jgi:hypothetical protein
VYTVNIAEKSVVVCKMHLCSGGGRYGSLVTVQPQPRAPSTNLIAAIAAGTQPDLAFTLAKMRATSALGRGETPALGMWSAHHACVADE